MDFFGADTKLVDLINTNYRLLPILNRLGVGVGFGDLTVGEICEKKGLDVGFFLSIVNVYHNESILSEQEYLKYPLELLIEYFKRSHNYYRNSVIAKHYELLREFKNNSFKDIEGIDSIFNVYGVEVERFMEHMEYEDNVVFPYLLNISQGGDGVTDDGKERILEGLEDYHENLVDELYDMKNLLLKYFVSDIKADISNELLYSIFEFANDLNIHSKMEESVLLEYVKK